MKPPTGPLRFMPALVAVSVMGSACTQMTPPPPNPGALPVMAPASAPVASAQPPRPLDGTAWTLDWLPGVPLPAQPLATLRFEAGQAVGSDSCNRFATSYRAAGSSLEFSAKAAATLMACPPEVMQVANAFGAVLYDTRSYSTAYDTLTLVGADGTPLGRLKAQADRLAGTSWQVSGLNNGRQAVVGVIAGTSLTMSFGADGRLSGSAGCNTYTAPYTADGRGVHIGAPATTRKACALPLGVMAQEQAFLAALPTAATQQRDGDRLELRTAEGALAVGARRAAR